MSASFPTGVPEIDRLLAKLSTLVHKHGRNSNEVDFFIEKNRDVSWTDLRSQETVYFEEFARSISILMEGFKVDNIDRPDPTEAADYWKTGQDPFKDIDTEENSKDPADWWKNG